MTLLIADTSADRFTSPIDFETEGEYCSKAGVELLSDREASALLSDHYEYKIDCLHSLRDALDDRFYGVTDDDCALCCAVVVLSEYAGELTVPFEKTANSIALLLNRELRGRYHVLKQGAMPEAILLEQKSTLNCVLPDEIRLETIPKMEEGLWEKVRTAVEEYSRRHAERYFEENGEDLPGMKAAAELFRRIAEHNTEFSELAEQYEKRLYQMNYDAAVKATQELNKYATRLELDIVEGWIQRTIKPGNGKEEMLSQIQTLRYRIMIKKRWAEFGRTMAGALILPALFFLVLFVEYIMDLL